MSSLLEDPMVLREIIMDHYQYPHNHKLTDDAGYHQVHMASESCIDDITVQSKINPAGSIEDVRFDGVACTISTSSTSIMTEPVSYTHLDVYKRQVWSCCAFPSFQRGNRSPCRYSSTYRRSPWTHDP